MRIAVVQFPGSNSARDYAQAMDEVLQKPVTAVWHQEEDLSPYDVILLPGGFSYGDYLRAGALAQFSPVIKGIKRAQEEGKLIIGIGNGFQILLEAGLLPGAILRNDSQKFCCRIQPLTIENEKTPFTANYQLGERIRLPIAHEAGNYVCDEETLESLKTNRQIVFRYAETNPNGSTEGIAGITNRSGNVLGMMPHPERAVASWMGSEDGVRFFTSMFEYWRKQHVS